MWVCISVSKQSRDVENSSTPRSRERKRMGWWWTLGFLLVGWCIPPAVGRGGGGEGSGRLLMGYKETRGNASFHCSPSGPCLPCQYSEKNDEKYRCSETGYRVPLKCVKIQDSSKEKAREKNQRRLFSFQENKVNLLKKRFHVAIRNLKHRKLLDELSTSEDRNQSYITYRSCVPADEEKLSVLGFEVIMLCLLLVSGSVIYLRQKRVAPMPGAGAIRLSTSVPRF